MAPTPPSLSPPPGSMGVLWAGEGCGIEQPFSNSRKLKNQWALVKMQMLIP